MKDRIGLASALGMLGVDPRIVDPDTERFYARLILQGIAGKKDTPNTLGIFFTNSQLMIDPDIHEIWTGEIAFRKLMVRQDTHLNHRGAGVGGLVTDGGFDLGSYDRIVMDKISGGKK